MARSRTTDLIEQEIAERMRPPREGAGEPFAGLDVSGFVPRADLGTAEKRAFLGTFPRRSLWPDLDALNEELAEQTQHLTAAQERASALLSERVGAPERDADTLAEWHLAGCRGVRPEPTVLGLDAKVAEAQLAAAAAERVVDAKFEERGAFVERHRDRLTAVAEQQVAAAGDRMLALVDELEHARAALTELRASELWARCYPHASAAGEVPTSLVAAGRAAPIEHLLGLRPAPQLIAGRLLDLLRKDAELLATAMTAEQSKLIEGDAKPGGAFWADSDEGRAWERKQRQEAIARHEREWGRPPA